MHVNQKLIITSSPSMSSVMESLSVVPDVIDTAPPNQIKIHYPSGVNVDLGNELTPTQVKDEPQQVEWPVESGAYYTMCMTDPDAPSRAEPTNREILHWLVGSIQGNNIKEAETLCQYVGSGAPLGTGLHRYVFLVYKQPGLVNYDKEIRISNRSRTRRVKFSIRNFASKYNLGAPIAGNLFQAQYDDYVPILREQLLQEP